MESILSVQDVTVAFGGLIACDDVSFDVERGELLALIGPNGAGKTTLLNVITGVYEPSGGAAITLTTRDGASHDLIGPRPHEIVRLGVARTFQNLGLFPYMSVQDNLMLGRYVHQKYGILSGGLVRRTVRQDEAQQRARVTDFMDMLDIKEYASSTVGSLPYGIQKRIELGRVLLLEPELVLLDEPMAGMSGGEKRDLMRVIHDVRGWLSITVLLIEHDMDVVMGEADRVLALSFGRRLALGTPTEVQANPAVIEAYLG